MELFEGKGKATGTNQGGGGGGCQGGGRRDRNDAVAPTGSDVNDVRDPIRSSPVGQGARVVAALGLVNPAVGREW